MHVAVLTVGSLSGFSRNNYARRVAKAARGLGHIVDLIEVAGHHPLADEPARQSARDSWSAVQNAVPVIDGPCLSAFAPFERELDRAAALIHYPTPLPYGASESERVALRAVECRLLPLLRRVICTSDEVGQRLCSEFGVQPARLSVVAPGTDDAERSTGSGEACCHILSIGDLVPRKGHDVLLRALSRLLDLDWRVSIVGSAARNPDCAAGLQSLAGELALAGRVRFLGEVAAPALETLWRGADLFALATHWESYGTATAEALRRGVPVAVTATGAAAKLVPIEGGVVCRPGDHEQLSKSMRRLIFDVALRRDMAEISWQAGQRLPSWTEQARAFVTALTTDT